MIRCCRSVCCPQAMWGVRRGNNGSRSWRQWRNSCGVFTRSGGPDNKMHDRAWECPTIQYTIMHFMVAVKQAEGGFVLRSRTSMPVARVNTSYSQADFSS